MSLLCISFQFTPLASQKYHGIFKWKEAIKSFYLSKSATSALYLLSTHRIDFDLKAEMATSASPFPKAPMFLPGDILP